MKENFDLVIQYVLNDEGGYVERENEPGGAVNFGISFLLFKEMWAKEKRGVPTFADLHAIDEKEAGRLYHTYVFPLVGFDTMPIGLDYVMVNTATMQGPTGAIRLLQKGLGFGFLDVTGKLDKKTWDAVASTNVYKMIGGLLVYQMQSKMKDPRVGKWVDAKGKEKTGFGSGWSDRFVREWNRADAMINK